MTVPGHYDGDFDYICEALDHDMTYGVLQRIDEPKTNTIINTILAIFFALIASNFDLFTSNLPVLAWNLMGLLFVWKLVELTTYEYFLKFHREKNNNELG